MIPCTICGMTTDCEHRARPPKKWDMFDEPSFESVLDNLAWKKKQEVKAIYLIEGLEEAAKITDGVKYDEVVSEDYRMAYDNGFEKACFMFESAIRKRIQEIKGEG